jgi:hypothetical protein
MEIKGAEELLLLAYRDAWRGEEDETAITVLIEAADELDDPVDALSTASQWCFKNSGDGLPLSEADENRLRAGFGPGIDHPVAEEEQIDRAVERAVEEEREAEGVADALAEITDEESAARRSERAIRDDARLDIWQEQARWHVAEMNLGIALQRLTSGGAVH